MGDPLAFLLSDLLLAAADALAGFDDDDDDDDELQFAPTAAAASSQQPTASSSQAQPAMQQRVAPHAPSDGGASTSAAASSSSTPQASTAAGSSKQGRMQFDPLKRNKGAGAGKKASSSRPALTPEVKHLQEDLAALMSEWSQGAQTAHRHPTYRHLWFAMSLLC